MILSGEFGDMNPYFMVLIWLFFGMILTVFYDFKWDKILFFP